MYGTADLNKPLQTRLQSYWEQHLRARGDNINRLSVLSCDVDHLLSCELQLIRTPVSAVIRAQSTEVRCGTVRWDTAAETHITDNTNHCHLVFINHSTRGTRWGYDLCLHNRCNCLKAWWYGVFHQDLWFLRELATSFHCSLESQTMTKCSNKYPIQ